MTDVLHLADLVAREAKSTGRNQVMGATEAMMENLRKRGVFIRADEIQAALEKGEMHYEVQPIWNMESQSIEGFEALIRWDKPDGTRVMPGLFIDLLYEVIREPKYKALKNEMRRDCLAKLSAFPKQYVSFNYTLEQLGYDGAAQDIIEALGSIKDHPEREIIIEVSERAMTARVNSALLRKEMTSLQQAGYKIALDDFGVESSNLNRLQEYPISIVKIDKALISNIATSEVQRATLEGLSLTLKTLGIKMILEGVETEKQADILFDVDLTIHQGFLHARPMPPEEVEANLSKIGKVPFSSKLSLLPDSELLADMDSRICFHNELEVMEADFSKFDFATSEIVHHFYDRLERRIEETGELRWFFLVNLSGMKIEPSAWYAYSRRGRSLNEAYSMGSVRFDPSEEARLQIERAANIEAFEPNLFSTRDEALAKIKSFQSTRRNSSVEAILFRQDTS